MCDDKTRIALQKLDDTHNRSDKDGDADSVQSVHLRLPEREVVAPLRWHAGNPQMEDTGGDDEEAEEDDLHKLLCLEVSHL